MIAQLGVLSAGLFEQGEDAYWQAAGDHLADPGLPPVPHLVKDVSLRLVAKLTGAKIFDRYGHSLAEAVGTSYKLVTAETWEDIDTAHARDLMDAGLALLREEHLASGQPGAVDPSDPGERIYYTTGCILGQHPAFTELSDYLSSRNAANRLQTVDHLFLGLNEVAARVKRRHAEAFSRANLLAWLVGQSLGMLAVIGEPTTMSL